MSDCTAKQLARLVHVSLCAGQAMYAASLKLQVRKLLATIDVRFSQHQDLRFMDIVEASTHKRSEASRPHGSTWDALKNEWIVICFGPHLIFVNTDIDGEKRERVYNASNTYLSEECVAVGYEIFSALSLQNAFAL